MKEEKKKEGGDSNHEISFLSQLIVALEQAEEKMEKAYRKENQEQLKITSDFILKVQRKISEAII